MRNQKGLKETNQIYSPAKYMLPSSNMFSMYSGSGGNKMSKKNQLNLQDKYLKKSIVCLEL